MYGKKYSKRIPKYATSLLNSMYTALVGDLPKQKQNKTMNNNNKFTAEYVELGERRAEGMKATKLN